MFLLIAPLLLAANCVAPACTPVPPPISLRGAAPVRRVPDPAAVLAFAGPTIPVADVPASLRWYEQRFKMYADSQWLAFGPRWDAGNSISGYERAAIYYVWWARTGNTEYLDRAHKTAVDYRDNYLIPAGYATSPHWSQMESMYLDCIVVGDQKRTILRVRHAGKDGGDWAGGACVTHGLSLLGILSLCSLEDGIWPAHDDRRATLSGTAITKTHRGPGSFQ